MRVADKKALGEMPCGTVFTLYTPRMLYNDIHILTGTGDCGFSGELTLFPFIDNKIDKGNLFESNWSTVDTSLSDYDDRQQFAVFNKAEVQQMINALIWALTGCAGYFDENIWVGENGVYPEDVYHDIIET